MSQDGRVPNSASLVGTMLGRYKLERMLGEGGMGVVYAARHQDLGRPAAVKILNARYAASEEVRTRFLREGQAASSIRHPNIVDVYDVGTDGGRAYLVMELLEGEDLRHLLSREGPLSAQLTADLLVPVVSALAAAHDIGVVHRDLKPDNIFLATGRNKLAPKVVDFGVSKVIDEESAAALTGTGALLGTPYYMSPEQARSEKRVDGRSDQYAVGVIAYECVTGRRPLEDPSIYHLIHRIVNGDFAPPRQLNPNIPGAFEQLILTAMACNRDERFPSTRALGLALLAFAGDRVRANYAEEFATDDVLASTIATPAATTRTPELGTTLGESVHERDSPRRPPSGRATLPLVGLLVLLVGFIAAVVRQISKSAHPERAATRALEKPAVASAPAPVAAPRPPASSAPEVSAQKNLISDPPGASAWIGGKSVGQAPLPIDVPAGAAVDVELRLAGFEPQRRQVTVSDPREITVKLLPKPLASKEGTAKRAARPAARPELAPR